MRLIESTNNEEVLRQIRHFIRDWPTITSFSTATSGSTGEPKIISIKKDYAIRSAEKTLNYFQLEPGSNALLCLSPNTIAGKMMLIRALTGNLNLIIGEISSNPLQQITQKLDFAAMVPMQLENSINEFPEKLKSIRNIIVGGAPISASLEQKIIQLKLNVYQTFGMTETISHIALRKIDKENKSYKALPGVTFTTIEQQLVINAPDIGVNNLLTNDIVQLVDNKQFVWLGRADFVINSGGIKIHPEQVEEKLKELISAPFFSAGMVDETLGQKHVIVVKSDNKKIDKSHLSNFLTTYEIPREIYYVDTFIYTESGKLNRVKTMELLENAIKEVL